MASMSFRAPWSLKLLIITILTCMLFLGFAVACLSFGFTHDPKFFFVVPIPVALLAFVYFFHFIRAYSLTHDAVVVERFARDIRIPLRGLEAIEIDPEAMSWTLSMTNGGLFSFGGSCYNKRLGRYKAYATDPKRSVILRFKDATYVLTPHSPELFMRAVEAASTSLSSGA